MVSLNIELPQGFLDEETRCNFTVPKKLKEVWAVELDLLAEFQRVCNKYNIKYVASGGTMLGAVRHHGFIPWDDDIDLMMLRDDYEKLCNIAPSEFKHPYFFQTEYTDFGSLRGHAQLRNSKTTGILLSEKEKKFTFNQGIFLDIFPLDNVPDDLSLYLKQGKEAMNYKYKFKKRFSKTQRSFIESPKKYKKVIKKILFPILKIFYSYLVDLSYKKFEEVCKKFNREETRYVSKLSFDFNNKRQFIKRKDLDDIIDVQFEYMRIPIIANYDEILRLRYNNYMEPAKAPNYHGGVFLDTEKSYKEYIK